jgi:hypothetical protein
MDNLKKKIQMAREGKEIFKNKFWVDGLDINDCFILILTKNEECIHYAAKYLSDFVALYQKRRAYILLTDSQYTSLFSEAGGEIKICTACELYRLTKYFNVFHQKECIETRVIFITEKDGQGLFVEKLLEKKAFSLEEYIAISLYQLDGLKEE